MKVQDLMAENVVTAKEQTTIEDAVSLLFRKHADALVITDEGRKCKGIFTERDILRSIAKKMPLDTHLEEVMSRNVLTVRKEDSFARAKRLMVSHSIRHLPVVDEEGYLVGMLTMRRILDELVGIPTFRS